MDDKTKIKFMERKRRSMDICAKEFGKLARTMYPTQETFMKLREQLTYLEKLHSKTSKEFLSVIDKFWKHYDLDAFLESENYTYDHMMKCKNGQRSYSPILQEVIINYVKKVTK